MGPEWAPGDDRQAQVDIAELFSMRDKNVLITGVSVGLGARMARVLHAA
jgi:hypothetical protein